jgi:hypothetical protein
MKKLIASIAIILLSSYYGFAVEAVDADKIAIKYCQEQYIYMGSYQERDSSVVNEKLYLERMLELKDGKLNAHYSKDLIRRNISMYERFLKTKKTWKNSDLTEEEAINFTSLIQKFKHDLDVIEKYYPTDYEVFERAEMLETKLLEPKKANNP